MSQYFLLQRACSFGLLIWACVGFFLKVPERKSSEIEVGVLYVDWKATDIEPRSVDI